MNSTALQYGRRIILRGAAIDSRRGKFHQRRAEISQPGVDPFGLFVMASTFAASSDNRAIFIKRFAARIPVTEIEHAFRTICERRVNLPANLRLGGIGMIAKRQRIEKIPERNMRSQRLLPHDLQVLAISFASVRIR